MPKKSKRSLQEVVGKETYTVWVDMLNDLVPDGRTHRLSVVVAGMLLYAVDKSMQLKQKDREASSVALSLIEANEAGEPETIKELLHDLVDRLFKEAGVGYERVSRRGERYSIADEIYNEFSIWYNYPWD